MTPKEAHEWLRKRVLPCPCCGSGLVLTAGNLQLPEDARENVVAAEFMRTAGWLYQNEALQLETIEDAAERAISGGLVPPAPMPRGDVE